MMTVEQAGEVWCPMVRIARIETFTYETARIPGNGDHGDVVAIRDDHHIVGGCNTDALGSLRVPASCRCIADKCAMWRWADAAVEARTPETWWPEDDYQESEPARPLNLPASAEWVPLTGKGNNLEGGYWIESIVDVDLAVKAASAVRRGYCGLAGRPDLA